MLNTTLEAADVSGESCWVLQHNRRMGSAYNDIFSFTRVVGACRLCPQN